MSQLIYKELKLSITRFLMVLPFLLGLLFFIPQWIFLLVFMYFFWISIPQIYGGYLAQGDYQFISILPVRRRDIVTSKSYALFIMEGLHLIFALVFGLIHVLLYGSSHFFFDINFAFFGVAILMFGIFNIVFIPRYFKTAHYFGLATIYATIATMVYGFILEFGIIKYQFMKDVFEGSLQNQVIVFVLSVILGVGLSIYAMEISKSRFDEIDL